MLEDMKVAVAGASGFIGSALVARLTDGGDQVVRFVRRPAEAPDEITWHPSAGDVEHWDRLEGVEAMVNLGGANLAAGRWTDERKSEIERSRIEGTRTLVATMARMNHHPRRFVSVSAVGYYGDRGEEELTESSPPGEGFLSDVCRAWEDEALIAHCAGIRTMILRLGLVLGRGGVVARMLPAFRAGVGGPLGNGRQWVSWIALGDLLEVIHQAMRGGLPDGVVNVVAPDPVRNRDFARTLGRVLHRPAVLPVPALALRALFGEMADQALLASTRAVPARLLAAGFPYRLPDLTGALRQSIG